MGLIVSVPDQCLSFYFTACPRRFVRFVKGSLVAICCARELSWCSAWIVFHLMPSLVLWHVRPAKTHISLGIRPV